MTLEKLSYLLESFFYNGVVKSDSRQLNRFDLLEYAKIAYATVMRNLWFQLKKTANSNETYFLTGSLARKEFELKSVGNKKSIDLSKTPVIYLPENKHIFSINPINEAECSIGIITLVQPAESRFYKDDADFSTFAFCEPIGNYIDFYNLPECVKKIELEAVFDDIKAEIPNDIAADIVKYMLKDMLAIKQINVDKIDDNNPNEFVQQLKSKLNDAIPN